MNFVENEITALSYISTNGECLWLNTKLTNACVKKKKRNLIRQCDMYVVILFRIVTEGTLVFFLSFFLFF